MMGWRTNEPAAFFAVVEPQPLNILTVGPTLTPTSYVIDNAGNYLTDDAGDRLTV